MEADQRRLAGLIRRAQGGDADAFRDLVSHVHGRIHRWAIGMTADPDEADDVVQAALIKLYRHLGDYRGDAALTTWLYTIVRSAASEQRRRQDRRASALDRYRVQAQPPAVQEGDAAAGLDASALTARVHAEFRALPARQRQVFDLVDLQGHSTVRAAEMLGIDAVTVRTNLLRARRAIRTRILRSHPELVEEYGS